MPHRLRQNWLKVSTASVKRSINNRSRAVPRSYRASALSGAWTRIASKSAKRLRMAAKPGEPGPAIEKRFTAARISCQHGVET